MLPRNNELLCGVVEGFYGRPWRTDQRKDLFCLMKRLGLNTYMYAPKDDAKHRAYWKDLYSVEEADHLTALITAARESDVQFVYALSPGLDIIYSSPKEVTALKRKLEQVSQFGCKAFALLFDDIDTDLCQADKDGFQSLAHAQVSVTNEVYEHLNQPCFLLCPTEYCATRATPSVESSEYLATIGSKLLPDILFMWTGPKVVSKNISVESIKKLSSVIKRKPVIWDNIHANDYDQKRLFLGPYEGRSTELIPYLNGVMTNPNCEYESNFIAFHTLASWAKSDLEEDKQDHAMGDIGDISDNPTIAAEIKLERDGDNETRQSPVPNHGCYRPEFALKAAIADWLEVIQEARTAEGLRLKSPALMNSNLAVVAAISAPIPSINTCMAVTQTTNTVMPPVPPEGTLNADLIKNSGSNYTPMMNPVNSLVTKTTDEILEPMDCLPENGALKSEPIPTKTSSVVSICPPTVSKNFDTVMQVDDSLSKDSNGKTDPASNSVILSSTDTNDTEMQIDVDQNGGENMDDVKPTEENDIDPPELNKCSIVKLTVEDVALLVDLFYLPYEHGKQAVHLLEECYWLKSYAYAVTEAKRSGHPSDKALEWSERAAKFVENGKRMKTMFTRLMNIPNRALLYDLYGYIWDMEGVISMLVSFVKWLGGNHTHREAFMSGDLEPWVFRGGLTGELQRMLPIDGANDLFYKVPPKQICNKIYTIRPFRVSDELGIFRQCRLTYQDGKDATDLFPDQLHLPGNQKVGALLTFSPEYCFVAEEDGELCGYALATLDSLEFQKKCEVAWLPEMCMKYPKPEKTEGLNLAEEIIVSFHNHKPFRPVNMFQRFPSLLTLSVLPTVEDQGVLKNLLACILSALKANGSRGAYSEVLKSDHAMIDFYKKLGFFDVPLTDNRSEDFVILGRSI
ncbi:protein O-GlcNAcase-like isoform X2 [Anneissia japonica]|uniref:protein O-GlcNAcase-like isoform X2 n=1 Tax=Anneissia japonica TaxID=1529436 RepID=UPI001425B040|nr:protein O-GlcNAcase-like isoform X2 [Anneissia japonica]